MSASKFVLTAAIRQAVTGREAEVLAALGIDWRSGRPHITCPYPRHADGNPSWRWDPQKARAFCSCIEKSDSIFDVAMSREEISFDDAKLHVAQILGREDLINGENQGRYQATDAASLLSPAPDNRDDELVFRYLGARLGIDPAEVLAPSTRVVGIKLLAYFDPPPRVREKPKLIGFWPCAVFETAAASRRHAHRIYLALNAQAKADLGTGPDGRRRDPKKWAKTAKGDISIGGTSVFWGDPMTAPHIVVSEGIETGAANAMALRADIESCAIAVAAAITAGGIEAFQIWPATKRVTVAADRDEAKQGAGYKRGERAARKFGLINHERVEVHIALPGEPGQSADWLDVLLRGGLDEVRSGILDAPVFEPNAQETARDRKLKMVAKTFPLPSMDMLRVEYRYTRRGEIWVHKFEGEESDEHTGEKSETWTPVASPMGVPALLQMADADDAYGLRTLVQDMSGEPRVVDFERKELGKLGATEIRARLFEAGLRVEADGEHVCVQLLKAAKPMTCITVVSRPGWHRYPDMAYPVFISPTGEAIGVPDGTAIELERSVTLPGRVGRSGTIEGWRQAVRAAVLAENCPHWVLGTVSGFAGAIIDLTGLDTCGLNLSGKTSLGKTTAQQLGVSAWSSPKLSDRGLLRTWRATENAVEVHARDASGTLLAPDEMAHADGKMIGRVLYSLAGDVGKARMRPDSTLRRSYTWSTFGLLSGEKSLEQKIRDDGGQWTGGMAVRFPDVDVTGVNPGVAKETIDAVQRISTHYGHAGPEFVRKLVESGLHRDPNALRERILVAARHLAGDGADSSKIRAATPFAVLAVAGALAQELGILPNEADVAGAVRWAWERFCGSTDALALDPDLQAIANIRQWVAERWGVTIKPVTIDGGINNREAVAWYDDDTVYIPTARIAEAAGHALKEQRIAAMLDHRSFLSRRGDDAKRIAIKYVPKIGHVQSYALRRSEFGRPDQPKEPLYAVAGDD